MNFPFNFPLFGRSRALKAVQHVAISPETDPEWVKNLLTGIRDPLDPPSPPEPEPDYWLVDNAARVVENQGELPNDR